MQRFKFDVKLVLLDTFAMGIFYYLNLLLTYLLTPWSRVLLAKLTGSTASQEIPRIFGTRSSSPYSQVPATCSHPEPTPSNPHKPLPPPEEVNLPYTGS